APLGAGNGLADAVRCINDGAEGLAEVPRNNGNWGSRSERRSDGSQARTQRAEPGRDDRVRHLGADCVSGHRGDEIVALEPSQLYVVFRPDRARAGNIPQQRDLSEVLARSLDVEYAAVADHLHLTGI